MDRFPYITAYVNESFSKEKTRLDYIFLRPILLVLYFLLRVVAFPFKFIFHRRPYGFESRCIDRSLALGLKYLAAPEAAELLIRHVQIEPLLYRFLLGEGDAVLDSVCDSTKRRKLNGIDGDFGIESIEEIVGNNMTIAHDDLSYEVVERFDKDDFLRRLDLLRSSRPLDHNLFNKQVLAENKKYSLGWLGCTNVVMLIVFSITIFADLKTSMRALNSFGSDSLLLWCLKHVYAQNQEVLIDLDFYMQVFNNRGHYSSSAFFSDPSQYLYFHIVFDEFAYDTLRNRPHLTAA